MTGQSGTAAPTIIPLGDRAVLVRFADTLSAAANLEAIAFAARLDAEMPEGIEEIAPGLVSVLLRTQPGVDFWRLSGELRLRLGAKRQAPGRFAEHKIPVVFDGEDVDEVARLARVSPSELTTEICTVPVRVLATGFAPGFVYCGFHSERLLVPRREQVRPMVPAGTVLFAAGQTAIAATPIRTGWHVIGRTSFQNFDASADPPTRLRAGDLVHFVDAA